MEPSSALAQRRLKPLSPYPPKAWSTELKLLGLKDRYPHLVRGLEDGFQLGVPKILHTYTPLNNPSVNKLQIVYNNILANEFTAGRYIGPFTRRQLESELGPFQTSPLSLVPKASKPGKYRAVHDFSYPHSPLAETTSVNAHIDSDNFPCTWGTFSTVVVTHCPPSSRITSFSLRRGRSLQDYTSTPQPMARAGHPAPGGRPVRGQHLQQFWAGLGRRRVQLGCRHRSRHFPR